MKQIMEKRELSVVTAEIITITRATQKLVLDNSIEIGRRLCEAKELIGHGGWGEYLKTQVEFSESTAQNLMRIFREYGDGQMLLGKDPKSQTFGGLTYSQAVTLLALPEDDREDVVKTHDMENTTIAQLRQIIEEKTASLEDVEEQLEQGQNIAKDRDRLQGIMAAKELEATAAAARVAALEEKLAALESGEGDAVATSPDVQLLLDNAAEATRRETEKKLQATFQKEKKQALEAEKAKGKKELEKLQATMRETAAALETAKREAQVQATQADKLRSAAAISGIPQVDRFKERFEGLQSEINRLTALIAEVKGKDEAAGEKLKAAMLRFVDIFRGQVEGV